MPRLFLIYAIYHQMEIYFDNDILDDFDLYYWDDDDFTDHELVLRIYSFGDFGDALDGHQAVLEFKVRRLDFLNIDICHSS